jgi:hypothetical protein
MRKNTLVICVLLLIYSVSFGPFVAFAGFMDERFRRYDDTSMVWWDYVGIAYVPHRVIAYHSCNYFEYMIWWISRTKHVGDYDWRWYKMHCDHDGYLR